MEEIQELTNKELADELKRFGTSPGPIISTTRSVYEKRLLKLRSGEIEKLSARNRYTEVPDDEEKSPPPKPRSPRLRKRIVQKIEPEVADEMDDSGGPDLRDTEPGDTSTTETPQSTGMYAKIFIFIIVLFFVYLIYINMESSGNLVPKIKGN
ncbi:emerin homolog 1-like [Ostrea edulis]|uniref:emerin homolog 1-like n=1 Tax=Ostrea edulis TaxID=37623 RepID=UPI0024AE9B04|nr:emerin homolog 1-like [Ostrea edulis]XP_056000766.1 emerin homolog 1-like [Ostrea edulis]